ncbi:MAG: succinate dehydrogenase, cytochrome b556 subunit [Alphaproteobacteria bacterium]
MVQRPLSPHLEVYRPQITSVLSITHRLTGVALIVGIFVFALWVAALGFSQPCFEKMQGFFGSLFGQFFLLGWTWSLFYHLFNGIRHLVWDTGHGYDLKNVYRSGWFTVIGSVLATAITVIAAYASL